MRRRKVLWLAAAVAAACVMAGAWPALARAYKTARHRRWFGQVAQTYARLRSGVERVQLPRVEKDDDLGPGAQQPEESDDATLRRLATLAKWGVRRQDFNRQLMRIAAHEAKRWEAHPNQLNALDTAQSWVSLGPANARFEEGTDGNVTNASTGRITGIEVDPRDQKTVYVSTAGGGAWKTYDITAPSPVWIPITDPLGSLAVGAMRLDPSNPDTLWLGLGDAFDDNAGLLVVSHDGGGTWSEPIALSDTQPADGRPGLATNIRDIRIDPTNSNRVFVASDVGLFVAEDAKTFKLANLPTATPMPVEVATWSVVYLGQASGSTQWLLSGVIACDVKTDPPVAGEGLPAGSFQWCPLGNPGDIWKSTDSGKTWQSLRAAHQLPTFSASDGDFGRLSLAVGDTSDPAHTNVYVHAATVDEGGANTGTGSLAFFRSTDGGSTFTIVGRYDTPVTNPTQDISYPGGAVPGDCKTLDLAHDQAWYNLAIAVDPANPNNVIAGGNFCAARTTDGGKTWQNVAHWQAGYQRNITDDGALPYVHADWHVLTVLRTGSAYQIFAGTDGGLALSPDLFDAAPIDVTWTEPDNGLVTHLAYSVGSGDPADGNQGLILTGLQDNGTRVRDGVQSGASILFNQVIGGDGVGTVVSNNGATPASNVTLWASSPNNDRYFCATSLGDCDTDAFASRSPWKAIALPLPNPNSSTGDSDPFFIYYATLNDENGSVLTASDENVWQIDNRKVVRRLTPNGFMVGSDIGHITNIVAAPGTYTINGQTARLYAAALQDGHFGIGVDANGTATWAVTPNAMGIGAMDSQRIGHATSVAFPSSAGNVTANGVDGRVFVAASDGAYLFDGSLVPENIGHLFLTTDGGSTWTPLHGNGTGADLPNVPIPVVKFDPGDPTDHTLYVGTEIGVYRSTDQGQTWQRFGSGLPMARVTDIFIAKNSSLMRISTYGRGLWEIYPNAEAARGVAGDGDWDHNGVIDFFDLAALATRMGTTPATVTAPYYDWNCDLTGDANAIDEDDLKALVAKMGSHP